ncbi:MAG TPA: hypothetical protein VFM34_07350 [Moraxellaceae bacterium]|nr:hypothetical protein [Moraxellaceae bacterium]
MSNKFLHRITTTDSITCQQVTTLLTELQSLFIRTRTPVGAAISAVIRSWRQEKDGSFLIEFSALAAERLPPLSGMELLIAARSLAAASLLVPMEITA